MKQIKKREFEEVDAILPFMSLLIIIIPLLLSNLAFYHFRVVETSRPGASDPNSAPQDLSQASKERKITAQLLIEPSKVKLEFLDESDGRTVKKIKSKNSADGALKLFGVLKDIKAKFPKLNTVMVTTHEKVTYDKMMTVLDVFKRDLFVKKEQKQEREISFDDKKAFQFNLVIMPAIAELSLD